MSALCFQFQLNRETQESVSKFASPDHVFHRTYLGLGSKQTQEELPQPIQAAQDLAQFRWGSLLKDNKTHISAEYISYVSFFEPTFLSLYLTRPTLWKTRKD